MYKSHTVNNSDNFIAGWYIDETICDQLVNHFEKYQGDLKKPGVLGHDARVDKNLKDSIDMNIAEFHDQPPLLDYLKLLANCFEEYKKLYEYCDKGQDRWSLIQGINLQKYNPSGGYHVWHAEREGKFSAHRHLVYMTYLNDVTDDGETEWYYQKTKIKPEKGLTVIWPADWTYVHRGIASATQTKYIITGWYGYV